MIRSTAQAKFLWQQVMRAMKPSKQVTGGGKTAKVKSVKTSFDALLMVLQEAAQFTSCT